MKKNKGKKNVLSKLTREVQKRNGKNIHPNALCKFTADFREEKGNKNLKSNLDGANLAEYLEIAKLTDKKYEVLNEQIVAQNLNTNTNKEINQNQFSGVFLKNALKNSDIKMYETKPLAIPKRPKWKEGISSKEFEKLEIEAFLNWRRALALQEETNMNYAITPFEKNIEVWRQLWLVVEKSQILVQIVDGRNPLYFRCPDLEKYIKDIDPKKENILLINKADLMSESVRKCWSDYLNGEGVKHIFFSALKEGEKFEEENPNPNNEIDDLSDNEEEDEEEEDDSEDENANNKFKELKATDEKEKQIEFTNDKETKPSENINLEPKNLEIRSNLVIEQALIELVNVDNLVSPQEERQKAFDPNTKIYNREELIELFKNLTSTKQKNPIQNCYYVGFIGYPNVGKSSVINVLMMKKRVAVAQMPGKTKHYQTLYLPNENKDICLMDCPGLVFPSFTSSKGDMAVNGLIGIDTLREFHSPISIIIQKIPRRVLELFYKIELPDIYSATQFLQILAAKRGLITGRSLPDEAKTAKFVLKDYVSGKLLYCNLRPDYNEEIHGLVIPFDENYLKNNEILTNEEKEHLRIIKEIPADFDDDFDKINIDVDTERKLTTIKDNFDKVYFENIMNEELDNNINSEKKIFKDMKRSLKYAVNRGEITEEEYEEAFTVGDYENLLKRIQKNNQNNKKELVGVKVIKLK